MRYLFTAAAAVIFTAGLCLTGCDSKPAASSSSSSAAPANIKIGFLVKQPEEPWFQNEWKFAQKAADDEHFELIKIGATDGEKVLAAIDNLAAQGAQGFIICTPDTKLGPAIAAKAAADNLKLISVDDRFLGPDGQPLDSVHHVGVSAHDIGVMVGKALADQYKAKGWKPEDTAACIVTFEELQTARERTDGEIEALSAAGFPAGHIFKTPEKTSDVPGSFDATNVLLTQHPDVKHWLVSGMNDSASLGAVRALEGRQFSVDNVVAIGINGTDCLNEFQKPQPTGFYASVLLTPKKHGYDTATMMYHWIKDGTEPPKITYTTGILITRDTYKQVMKDQGLMD
ncbi:MAG TPA: arabinose ABC transporter substrate-binding protein [Tepidisphaeraceae bacterium]|jgi:L-arabinose transport system substrate-binding protein|nr:arabinose ABC transporter substrate-binding protein [Tepidisphaeraceae bacterium]